jgi:hypothetical protein
MKGIKIKGHTGAFEVSVICEDGTEYVCHSRKKIKADDISFDDVYKIKNKIKKARMLYKKRKWGKKTKKREKTQKEIEEDA